MHFFRLIVWVLVGLLELEDCLVQCPLHLDSVA